MLLAVPFGEGILGFEVPGWAALDEVCLNNTAPLAEPEGAIAREVEKLPPPPPSTRSVCIAFTDATRACPDCLLVPPILERLASFGVPDGAITLLCATGLHRPATDAEKRAKLGSDVVDRYRVVDHDAADHAGIVTVGKTPDGVPLTVNRLAVEADLLIATGVVEPHLYAGYSGGAKTVAIGCGGEPTIAATHGPTMLDRPGVRLGCIEANPFQQAVRASGAAVGLDFVLNVVQDGNGDVLAVRGGPFEEAHDALVTFARRAFEVEVPCRYDFAITGVGAPKDANLYQATRPATYLQMSPVPVVRQGGVIITPAPVPEGAGAGMGESRFLQAMREAGDMPSLVAYLRRGGYPPGAQRAFMLARVLQEVELVIVGAEHPDVVCDCKMTPAATMEEAFDVVRRRVGGNPRGLFVPNSMLALPVVRAYEPEFDFKEVTAT